MGQYLFTAYAGTLDLLLANHFSDVSLYVYPGNIADVVVQCGDM